MAVAVLAALIGSGGAAADERRLVLSLGAGEEYNDNVLFSSRDAIDDFVTRLLAGLRLTNRTERLEASLSGRLQNNHYAENDEFDGLDQHYAAGVGYWATPKLKTSLDASYSRDTQPDRDIEVTGFVLDATARESRSLGLGLSYALDEITSASFSYANRDQRYAGDAFSDYRSQRGGIGFSRRLDRFWNNATGRLNVSYAQYDYDTARTDYQAGTIGFLWRLTEVWDLQVDGGLRRTQSEFDVGSESVTDEGWGAVAALEFGYRGEYAAVSLNASHDIGPAGGRDGSVERTSGTLDLRYRFAERSWAGLAAGYHLNRAPAGELARRETDQDTLSLRPFLRFALTDRLFLEAAYGYTWIDDRVAGETYARNLVLLKLAFEQPILE